MKPTGKGWGVEDESAPALAVPYAVVTGNGISYHGGAVMKGNARVYLIWYGDWTNGLRASDAFRSVNLVETMLGSNGVSGSPYIRINTTYGDKSGNVSGNVVLSRSTTDNYSQGKTLTDAEVKAVVQKAISSGRLPKDTNGIYLVLSSSDVNESSGFCTKYCGWHTSATLSSSDIKYGFIGNADRCRSSCAAQTVSPNANVGADAMASTIMHEVEESLTDPHLNAWYDTKGMENADKCAWKFGPVKKTNSGAAYNQTFAGLNFLIQMNWENSRGGGCAQKKGGTFH